MTSSGSDFSVVEVYDPANNTWSTVAPMPTPRHGFGVGVVSGVLYTIGGYSFNTCNCLVGTVEAYDPISNTWSTKASMPTVRQDLVVAAINDGLYAVGGGNGGYLSTVEAYDPASDSWSTKSSMPTPRLGPAAGVVDGILYVVGGGTPSGSITTNEAYNPVSDTWSTKASMPTARYFTGAMGGGTVTVNEILYVIGGITSGHNTTSASEAYDATSDSWTQIAPMPTSRAPGIGIVNGVLYAVGGYDYVAGTALATNEAFTPMPSGVAVLNGGNAFTGNQTVSGSVSATSFVGSGASLTGVDAATLGGVAPSSPW